MRNNKIFKTLVAVIVAVVFAIVVSNIDAISKPADTAVTQQQELPDLTPNPTSKPLPTEEPDKVRPVVHDGKKYFDGDPAEVVRELQQLSLAEVIELAKKDGVIFDAKRPSDKKVVDKNRDGDWAFTAHDVWREETEIEPFPRTEMKIAATKDDGTYGKVSAAKAGTIDDDIFYDIGFNKEEKAFLQNAIYSNVIYKDDEKSTVVDNWNGYLSIEDERANMLYAIVLVARDVEGTQMYTMVVNFVSASEEEVEEVGGSSGGTSGGSSSGDGEDAENPTPTPTVEPTPTPTVEPTPTPTQNTGHNKPDVTVAPTAEPTPTPNTGHNKPDVTVAPTAEPTPTPNTGHNKPNATVAPTATETPNWGNTTTVAPTATETPNWGNTATEAPTATETPNWSNTATEAPSATKAPNWGSVVEVDEAESEKETQTSTGHSAPSATKAPNWGSESSAVAEPNATKAPAWG